MSYLLPLKGMPTALTLYLNGQPRSFDDLTSPTDLARVINTLGLKADRIAVEHNREIIPRSQWSQIQVANDDRLEIVHFVGGGTTSDY
jgi:thiamine biosynthesis protein ThiS